ncbi:MAG: enoyl-CoA hydratase/isomerase family protein [Acidobacteriota bacterium]
MIDLTKEGDVFVLAMAADENRWNTTFVRAFAEALDEVEASTGPAALVTRSLNEKFFSNGLDLAWVQAPDDHPEGGDREIFGAEFMALMGRIITLPVPTLSAINGHAFGAGLMCALCHDLRFMRADRGFLCANEMQLGLTIPTPELALFRHKLPAHVFYETVQLSRRWTGETGRAAGVVQEAFELDDLLPAALQRAAELAPLAAHRALFGGQKERLFGTDAVLDGPHGAAHMLKNAADFGH